MTMHISHTAAELGDRVAVWEHLAAAHEYRFDYRFDTDRGAVDPQSEFGHTWRDADGRWITPTSEYLAIHRELHALSDLGERGQAVT